MSLPASLALWLAIAATGGLLFAVHRRLQTAGNDLAEYRRALADVTSALTAADSAVRHLVTEGRDVAIVLAHRVAAAEALIGRSARPSRPAARTESRTDLN
jgi:hypothetical protein